MEYASKFKSSLAFVWFFKKCSLSYNCSVLITSTYCIFFPSLPNNPSCLLFGMLFSGFLLLLFLDFIAIRESWLVGCLFFIASSVFVVLTVIFPLAEFLNHYFFDWETKMHKGYFHMCFPQPSCFAWSSLGLRVCSCGCGAGCHARGYRSLPWHTDDLDHSHRGKPVLHCSWVTATIFVLWLCPACLQFAWLQYFFYFI